MKKITIFKLLINNYGFSINYIKAQKEYNINKKNHENDGSIKKFSFKKVVNEFDDWSFAFRYFWNYNLIFRIHLNR